MLCVVPDISAFRSGGGRWVRQPLQVSQRTNFKAILLFIIFILLNFPILSQPTCMQIHLLMYPFKQEMLRLSIPYED